MLFRSWWIGFLFLAFFLERLPSGLRPLLKISTLFLIVWNLLFVISAFSSIKNNGGTRGLHYGTDAEASQSKIRELCSRLSSDGKVGARLDLRDVPGILPYSLIYFFKHTPECAKKDLKFWPDSEGENSLSFRLNYSGGSARWDLH